MAHKTIGTVSYRGYKRRVTWDRGTGEVERSFGDAKNLGSELTSRFVGYASSREEALEMARNDLIATFDN
jgi:hypothetical protein